MTICTSISVLFLFVFYVYYKSSIAGDVKPRYFDDSYFLVSKAKQYPEQIMYVFEIFTVSFHF